MTDTAKALQICLDALKRITSYAASDGLSSEEYLNRHCGFNRAEQIRHNTSTEWQYLRNLDYDVAEAALEDAYEALKKPKSTNTIS